MNEIDIIKELEVFTRVDTLEAAKNSFWEFCHLKSPDFYISKEKTFHLWELCQMLQAFHEGRIIKYDFGKTSLEKGPWLIVPKLPSDMPFYSCRKLMLNLPPQHGKTRTLVNFSQWLYGLNVQEKIIIGSYNDDAASDFGRYVRDGIAEEKNEVDQIVFSDIFPKTKMKFGNASYKKWALEGQHFSFLSAGVGGSVTGKGGTIRIIDDLIKGAREAVNETHLQNLWLWYVATFGSRVSAGQGKAKDIICFTRWAKKDICGVILDSPEAWQWYVHRREVYDEKNDSMLCEELFDRESYDNLKAVSMRHLVTRMVFMANYHQRTIDDQNRLYKDLLTYNELPEEGRILRKIYVDTADDGADYLCSIAYLQFDQQAYILDVVYTQRPAEDTEIMVAQQIMECNVTRAEIEGNNGGKYFARNVKKKVKQMGGGHVAVKYFHQSNNKKTRIFSMSPVVQEAVFFPSNWVDRWPEFSEHILSYQKDGKAKHDDAEDALTGVAESIRGLIKRFKSL